MQTMKFALGGVWIAAMGLVSLTADIASTSEWMVLATLAVVPPILLMKAWPAPEMLPIHHHGARH